MNEREAIANLAAVVAVVATRCWETLGTAQARHLVEACREIEEAMASGEETP